MSAFISEKYLAGFLDADGCIKLRLSSGKVAMAIVFSQRKDRAKVLHLIQETYGGRISNAIVSDREYTYLALDTKESPLVLSRIVKHLVVKRHYAAVALDAIGKPMEFEEFKAFRKEQRRIKSLPIPKHPTRKWLAGYFDGDGCLSGSLLRNGTARVRAHIGAWEFDQEGIELIHKAFGGQYRKQGQNFQWYCDMDASKAIQILEFFGPHSIVKRNHVDVVLGHARSKHFRDGGEMVRILKALNAKPQRLSESTL